MSANAEIVRRHPWLGGLLELFDEVQSLLVEAKPTVIHGEYYPKNILFRSGKVYPVDWETAAVGAGEIDLATLTEAWPDEIVARCEQAYGEARYLGGPPAEFDRILAAARFYVQVYWLGHAMKPDQPIWNWSTVGKWRLALLQKLCEQLGLRTAPE